MRTSPLEELLAKVSSRYALANVVADRARQLIAGDLPAIETSSRNPVVVAMEELALGDALGKLHLEERPLAPKQDHELVPSREFQNPERWIQVKRTEPTSDEPSVRNHADR